jgi:hypothetical protein
MQSFLNGIRFSSSKTIDSYFTSIGDKGSIFTELTPDFDITEAQSTAIEVNKLKINAQTSNKNIAVARFYLNEANKNLVKKYLPLCDSVKLYALKNSINYILAELEPSTVEVKEVGGGIDIYEVNIILTYDNLVLNNFA